MGCCYCKAELPNNIKTNRLETTNGNPVFVQKPGLRLQRFQGNGSLFLTDTALLFYTAFPRRKLVDIPLEQIKECLFSKDFRAPGQYMLPCYCFCGCPDGFVNVVADVSNGGEEWKLSVCVINAEDFAEKIQTAVAMHQRFPRSAFVEKY